MKGQTCPDWASPVGPASPIFVYAEWKHRTGWVTSLWGRIMNRFWCHGVKTKLGGNWGLQRFGRGSRCAKKKKIKKKSSVFSTKQTEFTSAPRIKRSPQSEGARFGSNRWFQTGHRAGTMGLKVWFFRPVVLESHYPPAGLQVLQRPLLRSDQVSHAGPDHDPHQWVLCSVLQQKQQNREESLRWVLDQGLLPVGGITVRSHDFELLAQPDRGRSLLQLESRPFTSRPHGTGT